jgi:hypothetical protein
MPRAKRKGTGGRTSPSSRRKSSSGNGAAKDAIALLKADHREVEGLFAQFEKARSDDRKLEIAQKVCMALQAHSAIEEEIFYPAFLEATDETDIHHEAEIEHANAKKLIAQIESSGPEDEYFEAKMSVLKEMIKHHVTEEEKRGGMFTKSRQADMDLKALGERLHTRKMQYMAEAENGLKERMDKMRDVPGALLGRSNRSGRDTEKRQ